MKKILSLTLVLVILAALPVSITAGAAVVEQSYSDELYEHIVSSLNEDVLTVDVSDYSFPVSVLGALAQDIHDFEPQFFYLKGGFSYSHSGGKVYTLTFSYSETDPTVRAEKIKFVNDELDAIVATLPEGLDDFEKALYFHDYLCVNYQYDTTYTIYDIYNMLSQRKGVCQAYTGIYDLLLERVGIKNATASSSNHIWNVVYFNNKWYNVDVTWGDPLADTFGRACHDDFLVSDSVFNNSHDPYEGYYASVDTSYDSLSWHNCRTPFGFANGKTYMLNSRNVDEVNLLTGETSTIFTIDDKWVVGGYVYGVNSGFGSYKNRLIFNTPDSIMYFVPETGETGVVATPDIGSGNALFDLYVSGNTVYYLYGADYNAESIGSLELTFEDDSDDNTGGDNTDDPVTVPYDVNGDGTFNMYDYMMVKSIVLGKYTPSEVQFATADVNGSGKVDMFDYLAIKSVYFQNKA